MPLAVSREADYMMPGLQWMMYVLETLTFLLLLTSLQLRQLQDVRE